jgi:hypothetical protein
LASVAVSANDQRATPNRRASSAPASAASSVGIITDSPPRPAARRSIARSTGVGEWPAMAAVSPSEKSAYSSPSTSVTRAPDARSRYSRNPPAAMFIQVIGTRPNSEPARW